MCAFISKRLKQVKQFFFKNIFRVFFLDLQAIRDAVYTTRLSEAVLLAADELNLPRGDVNLDTVSSFARPRVNIDADGRRWSFDRALEKVRYLRSNLKIKTGGFCVFSVDKSPSSLFAIEIFY